MSVTCPAGETSSVGRLRLELLQRYFVRSREEGQFSPLGEGLAETHPRRSRDTPEA